MKNLSREEMLRTHEQMRKRAECRAGIDSKKVRKVVSSYLQIARDNQLTYNEFLQSLKITKDEINQSLNMLSISSIPETTSDAANV